MIPQEKIILYENVLRNINSKFINVLELIKRLAKVSYNELNSHLQVLNVPLEGDNINTQLFLKSLNQYSKLKTNQTTNIEITSSSIYTLENKIFEKLNPITELEHLTKAEEYFSKTFHELICLKELNNEIIPHKHQLETAKKVVNEMNGSGVIADEVGLGKTLTASLIALELFHRQLISNLLIIVPNNLLTQWIKEFKYYFPDRKLERIDKSNKHKLSLEHKGNWNIMTYSNVRDNTIVPYIIDRQRDCLIIDEGHNLRNETKISSICYSIPSKYKLLLTATPVHNSSFDIFNQINIVQPGVLLPKCEFKDLHVNEVGRIIDPILLKEWIQPYLTRTMRKDTENEDDFPERDMKSFDIEISSKTEKDIYNRIISILRSIYKRKLTGAVSIKRSSGTEDYVSSFIVVAMLILRELASHPICAIRTLDNPKSDVRKELLKLAEVTGDRSELDLIDELLNNYREPDIKLKKKGFDWFKKGNHSKTDKLINEILNILEEDIEIPKCIIFTEFRPTQEILEVLIKKEFEDNNHNGEKLELFVFNGDLSYRQKENLINAFNESRNKCILLSTEIGGEGLNFQSAGTIINFDFPWNPMRIEQRIGRIDRYKQKRKTVKIRNCRTLGTIEQYVYYVILKKLEIFKEIMGEFVPPITPLDFSENIDQAISKIILEAENDDEMGNRFDSYLNGLTDTNIWQLGLNKL